MDTWLGLCTQHVNADAYAVYAPEQATSIESQLEQLLVTVETLELSSLVPRIPQELQLQREVALVVKCSPDHLVGATRQAFALGVGFGIVFGLLVALL